MNLTLDSRDHHILVRALCLAIESIDAAPRHMQPASDRNDMAGMLDRLLGQEGALAIYQAEARRIVEAA